MYDFDTNSIIGNPIKSREADQLVLGYQQCYDELREGNVTPILHRLDNEVNTSTTLGIWGGETDIVIFHFETGEFYQINHKFLKRAYVLRTRRGQNWCQTTDISHFNCQFLSFSPYNTSQLVNSKYGHNFWAVMSKVVTLYSIHISVKWRFDYMTALPP
jgi:hypothetical protein